MSDLVRNCEDRFSRGTAHVKRPHTFTNEPVHEKTNNLGFRPGPT